MEKMAHFFSFKTPKISWINFLNFFLIAFIIVSAAFLRLYKIADYMTFLGDEGRDVLVVYNILHGKLTLLGPTASVGGFFLGPIYYYFIAPFLWLFNYSPVGPAVMVALFGIVTVWLVYKVGTEFFNKNVGLLAASLYAISPLIVSYSRSSWNPNLMPFFSLLTLYLLYNAIKKNSKKTIAISGISFGIAMQLHYISIFLGIIVAMCILYFRLIVLGKKAVKKIVADYLMFFAGFIIGWSPFLAFEARHGFQNIQNIVNFVVFPQGKDAISTNEGFLSNITNVFFRLFGRLVTNFPPPEQVSTQAHLNIFIWFWITILLAIGSCGVLIYYYKKTKEYNKKLQYGLFLIWLFFGIGLFGLYRKNIYDYYFGFMFPLPFFLVANLLFFFWSKKNIIRYFSVIIFIALFIINLQSISFKYPPNRQLAQTEYIAQFVLSKTEGKPYNFALISGANSDHAYRYFFKIWNKDPMQIETLLQDPQRSTVTDQLLVICEDPNCQPLGNASWEIAGFGRAEIVQKWIVSVVQVYKLAHYNEK